MDFALIAGKKILVVEDNSINQMLVRYTLSKSGAQIDIANNGSHALTFIESNNYDIILMDIHMPELDGYQTTQIIRNELHMNIPIVAMTALAIKGEEEKCLAMGMNGYVSKPFTTESLCGELIKVLSEPEHCTSDANQITDGYINIDLSFLNELSGSDFCYVKTMILLFLENMPNTINQLQENLLKQDWESVYKAAHYAKSSLSVIKIAKMYDLALQIGTIAKADKNQLKVSSLLNQFGFLFSKAENLLQKQINLLQTERQVA
jgi:CheY-like chemotaxis protein